MRRGRVRNRRIPSDRRLARDGEKDLWSLPMVVVDWRDSCSTGTWRALTVGFLGGWSRTRLVLLRSIGGNQTAADAIVIPGTCVTRIRRLR